MAATTQHALVQIAREALFNVVRHAEAHHAWVTLRWRPQVVSLAIADDGSGNHRKLQHQLFISRPDGGHLGLGALAGLSIGSALADGLDRAVLDRLLSLTRLFQAHLSTLSEEHLRNLSELVDDALEMVGQASIPTAR